MYLHPLNDCYIFFNLCLVILVQICTVYIWGDMWHSSQNLFMHWKKPLLPGSSYFFNHGSFLLVTHFQLKKNPGKISLCKMRVNIFWATKKPQNHQFPRQKEVKSRTCEAGKSNRLPPLISATFTTFSWRFLFFLGLRIFLLVPGFLWKSGWVYEECPEKWWFLIRRRSPTKTCKTYTMLDLWEDEDAWKERGVSKKHVPYWTVMLEFRVNGDNYFTPNFCTSSFSEWHHSSTNYLVISSHPPIWKKIMIFARFTPEVSGINKQDIFEKTKRSQQ